MPSFINTNMSSLNAQRNLNTSQSALQTSLQRLSSGLRINGAKDDAAGLAISNRMTSQINGNTQAARNANDGISLAQTAEGDLNQIGTNLQRMRDLAIQSANGTNSVSDRAALNSELQSLGAEIDRVAQNSSFNGVRLLDGTFTAQNFQVGAGATANDHIAINSISSARTAALGSAGTTSTATKVGTAITAALAAGDLTLNGQQVGASSAGIGGGLSTASATQVAVAINAVSSTSGVTATANSNSVTGSAATAFTTIASGTFSINGIAIGAVAAGGTAAGQGANIAAAVNQASSQTGVTASANATTGALTLTAADGRDIKVSLNATNAPATALSAQKTAFLGLTGLATANFGVTGTSTAVSGTYTAGVSATTSDLYKITVDGISVTSRVATAAGSSAANLDTDFVAFAAANTGYRVAGTIAAGNLTVTKLDGTAVVTNTAFTDSTGLAAAAGAITTPGGALFGGANPTVVAGIAGITTTQTADAGDTSNHGTVTLTSTGTNGIVVGGASSTNAGLTTGQTLATVVSSVSSVSAIDISTAAGAISSLSVLDGALVTINATRASLGAYQNRFASVVSSLQTTTENLTASRSRIVDTDFAAETASLSRNQILQQAGTAMLAQANQIPNGVLALLR